jgi:hypothetical protein
VIDNDGASNKKSHYRSNSSLLMSSLSAGLRDKMRLIVFAVNPPPRLPSGN